MKNKLYYTRKGLLILCLIMVVLSPLIALPQQVLTSGITFVPNRGQILTTEGKPATSILYVADADNVRLFFTKKGVSYVFYQTNTSGVSLTEQTPKDMAELSMIPSNAYRMDMELIGSNPSVIITAQEEYAIYKNYYTTPCTDKVERLTSFSRLTYKDIYPHIDLVFYSNGPKIKYDFIVRPGGDAAKIRFTYNGASSLAITDTGVLKIETPLGKIEEDRPFTYTDLVDKPAVSLLTTTIADVESVPSRYYLEKGVVSFALGYYDTTQTLIIDPAIQWATFAGGGNFDRISALKITTNGDIITAGGTQSINFPMQVGALQEINAGNMDWLIMRLDNNGHLLWSTYYGTSDFDIAFGVLEATDGSIWVFGEVRGQNLTTTDNAVQKVYGGGTADGAIVRLTSDGQLLYSTYYGGRNYEAVLDAGEDSKGKIWFTGRTQSADFPITDNAIQSTNAGNYDVFILGFDETASRHISTYWGSSKVESGESITIGLQDEIIIGGFTDRSTISTQNTFQGSNAGGHDSFIAVFNNNLQLQWGTFLGGNGEDYGNDISIDEGGNIYMRGITASTNFPTSSNAFQRNSGGDFDVFLTKFSTDGNRLWTTYFGGNGAEGEPSAFTIQYGGLSVHNGHVLLGGKTSSLNFPVTSDALQMSLKGQRDAFIADFDENGNRVWASYLGGAGDEIGYDIQQRDGLIYVGGYTSSNNFPITQGVLQDMYGGNIDGFIVKLNSCSILKPIVTTYGAITFCEGDSLRLEANTGYVSYYWSNGVKGRSIIVRESGTYMVTVTDTAGCSATSFPVVVYRIPLPKPTIFGPHTVCIGGSITIEAEEGFASYLWSNGATTRSIIVTEKGEFVVSVTDTNGCTGISQKFIVDAADAPKPNVTVVGSVNFCTGDSVRLEAETGYSSYRWSNGSVGRIVVVKNTGVYTVTVTANNGCIGTSASVTVTATPCDRVECTTIAGIINAYSKVTVVDASTGTLTVEDTQVFTTGSQVLLIQMQGAHIDTTNTPNYGSILATQGAGNYEFAVIKTKAANQIILTHPLVQTDYSTDGHIQLITVPHYDHVTVVDTLTCKPWDGETGGVVVISANCLMIEADISVQGKGFRGGIYADQPGSVTQPHYGEYVSDNAYYWAMKGEGIAGQGVYPFLYGKGSPANGGGGGNNHNAGGGGGAQYGNGGIGGYGYQGVPGSIKIPQGLGGKTLASLYNAKSGKLYMGGGGGSGHINHTHGSQGAAGGGIVILRSHTIRNNNHASISARGSDAPSDLSLINPDGCGGGGAGGSVLIDAYTITDTLVIDAAGGNGGSRTNSLTSSGPGGGGGGGFIAVTADTILFNKIVTRIDGGKAGTQLGGGNYGAANGIAGGIRADALLAGIPLQRVLNGCKGCIPVLLSQTMECGKTTLTVSDGGDSVSSVVLIDSESNNVELFIPGTLPHPSALVQITLSIETLPGKYALIVENTAGKTTVVTGTVWPLPQPPRIEWDGIELHSTPALQYQWFYGGNSLYNGKEQNYKPTLSGLYTVTVTDINGCSATSEPFSIVWTGVDEKERGIGVSTFPNPVANELIIDVRGAADGNCSFEVRNILGVVVLSSDSIMRDGHCRNLLPVSHLSSGVYFLHCRIGSNIVTQKFVKQ